MKDDNKKSKVKQRHTIHIVLQEGRTCEFIYSDGTMAREHYYQLQAVGVVGPYAIKEIRLEQAN